MNKPWLTALIAVAAFVADFASKAWAQANLTPGHYQDFIPHLLRFTLTTNTGGAFGIGRDHKEVMTLLSLTVALGVAYLIFKREKSKTPLSLVERCGLGMVLGGALGNLFDRFTAGSVTDFIGFTFFPAFPIFNVADALIDIGGVMFLIKYIAQEQRAAETAETIEP